jgi:hypothetical protein
MPLYKVATKGSDTNRLVEAASSQAAVSHCAHGLFTASTITKPADIAALMGAGVKLETAGVHPVEEPPANETRVNVALGLIEQRPEGSDGPWVEAGPASLAQLAEADPGATYRVDPKGGMVQRLPQGADSESGWEDIREATAEETAEAGPAPAKTKR